LGVQNTTQRRDDVSIDDVFADALPDINHYLAHTNEDGSYWYEGEYRKTIIRLRHEMHDIVSQAWSTYDKNDPDYDTLEAVRQALMAKVEAAWDRGHEPSWNELMPEISMVRSRIPSPEDRDKTTGHGEFASQINPVSAVNKLVRPRLLVLSRSELPAE
jgi:hypothetical protein